MDELPEMTAIALSWINLHLCLQRLGLRRSKDTQLAEFGFVNYKNLFYWRDKMKVYSGSWSVLSILFKSIKAWPHITPNVCKALLPYIYSVAVLKPRRKWPITRGREAAAR